MKRIHAKEMIRFANSDKGTMIWYRGTDSNTWSRRDNPSWVNGFVYVVDDKVSDIRKAILDGIDVRKENVTENIHLDHFDSMCQATDPTEFYIAEDGYKTRRYVYSASCSELTMITDCFYRNVAVAIKELSSVYSNPVIVGTYQIKDESIRRYFK